ncbi:hypothetical protein CLM65_07590 [Serratia marcescens]|uniref:hypothetical protein n=1 Tax=Serratia marcescens TaxID=615 RepID=UPI000534F6C7|nr:hypothetical protein [Serratia marcescens]ASM07455.1 hypothetical protein BVG91_10645 [Serratia marcescens]AVD63284.1 hypothetical protein C4B62_08700 [Serratia marcescens]AVN33968.1 hypothetical protein AM470_11590 [Serratia marcescens]AVN51279.1 hypothetical protein AM478_16745 [Serratia marcescens]AWC72884.1 hypothetical protein AM368_22975 [Serratia marcescens]
MSNSHRCVRQRRLDKESTCPQAGRKADLAQLIAAQRVAVNRETGGQREQKLRETAMAKAVHQCDILSYERLNVGDILTDRPGEIK